MALTKADIAEHLFTQLGMSKREAKDMVEAFLRKSDRRLSVVNKSRFQASVTLTFVRRISVPDATPRRARIFLSAPAAW